MMKSRTCAASLGMTPCLTSYVAAVRHYPSWGEVRPDCRACVSDATVVGLGTAVYADWKPRPDLHRSQESSGEERPLARAAPRFDNTLADFVAARATRRSAEPSPAESDAHWHAVVAAAALSLAAGSTFASLAARPATHRDALPVDVGPSLKAKARGDKSYRAFLDAVVGACRSPRAARLGVTRCEIEEERDMEHPRWITITLTVWFRSTDLAARMDAWREMRGIVDKRTEPLRNGDDGSRMRDIDDRFFISLGLQHV